MKQTHPPTRRALVIGCPGTGDKQLTGVRTDVTNLTNFLKSERGGKWYDEEVTTLYNPTVEKVKAALSSSVADYSFVYFAGHGFTSNFLERMIWLKDGYGTDTSLLDSTPKQLVVIDACRTFVQVIEGLPPQREPEYDHFGGSPARRLFDWSIANSDAGKLIIHGTQSGTEAIETWRGGVFTQALLRGAKIPTQHNGCNGVSIGEVLQRSAAIMKRGLSEQRPDVTFVQGNLSVYFAVTVPTLSTTKPLPDYSLTISEAKRQPVNKGNVGLGILAALLILWGLSE